MIKTILPMPGADVVYYPEFIDTAHADRLLNALTTQTAWQQPTIRMFGRTVQVPRQTAWHGDPGATYTYSGIRHEPAPWTPALLDLRHLVTMWSGSFYNSALLNHYRTGADGVGWHADDEPELAPCIASVSLGAPRTMRFKPRQGGKVQSVTLDHGSLLVMRGDTQVNWLHQIPKTSAAGQRINVTFRQVTTR